ncbi:MAG: DUF2199 domain-containing protein [Rhodospirillales bacterium]|nr:DUF2199 domain-containing protein [Acetobacter sp.]
MKNIQMDFLCRICGDRHSPLPLSFSVKAPQAVLRVPAEQRNTRIVITRDQCVIDGTSFFLRGRIPMPILDSDQTFIWGVWAEVSPKSFLATHQLWNVKGRERQPAYKAWLDTELVSYNATTLNLEIAVHTQPVGRRPHFEVLAAEHPLALEQRAGVPLVRVEQIASVVWHASDALKEHGFQPVGGASRDKDSVQQNAKAPAHGRKH